MPPTSQKTWSTSWKGRLSVTDRGRPMTTMTDLHKGDGVMTAATPGLAPAKGRLRILVIEDERGLSDVLKYNLEREGYEVTLAHDGQEGLRKAQTLLPDLVLLDLML